MNKIYKSFAVIALGLAGAATFTSCEDYLDKEPSSDISDEVPFKDFNNMQGYIEEIYNCIPDKVKCYWTTSWNLGDDEISTPQAEAERTMQTQVDIGNFYAWQNNAQFWFAADRKNHTSLDLHQQRFYGNAWYCIAKTNLALEKIDEYFVGTKEEKDILLGQLYFFRGWWHFEMMQFLGGLPYVNKTIGSGESPRLPRLSYLECADSVALDLKRAVELLPINWDETTPGKKTYGNNELRITKIAALAYLGKNYLWAASPLMQHGAQTGGSHTYDYDQELAKLAADAFAEVIDLVETGRTQYEFAKFDYTNVYDHQKSDGVEYSYSELFYTSRRNWLQPGGKEAILRGPTTAWNYTRWNYSRTFGPYAICERDPHFHLPTANYVANYGMANGLPIDDPDSGYDIKHPFKNRDPRFYHDIVFDGCKYINGEAKGNDAKFKYAGLATNGVGRDIREGSRTGYWMQKLVPHTANKIDMEDEYDKNPNAYVPYMRLADVYLMYAEACAVLGGPAGKSSKCSLTSVDAINRLRDRVGAGHVAAKFSGNNYMDEVRRERAVELAFEGFRFNDLQRWLLLTEPKYTVKTSQEFIRVSGADESYFAENDPAEAEVAEFRQEVILTRNFDSKHYWFPLLRDDTYIYAEFEQNPGW